MRVQLFVSSISSSTAIRGRHERVARYLHAVPHESFDVASDEAAKSLWKRKNKGNNELPFILVDGEPVGSIEQMDEAVEYGELDQFLRIDRALPSLPSDSPALPSLPTVSPMHYSAPPSPGADAGDSSFNIRDEGDRSVSLADFASLGLTPEEMAQLQAEIEAGETFDSATPPYSPTEERQYLPHRGSLSSLPEVAEQVTEPEVTVVRAGPERPISQDASFDDLEGIDITEEEAERLILEMDGGLRMDEISLHSPAKSRSSRDVFDPLGQLDESEEIEDVLSPQPLTAESFFADRRSLEGMDDEEGDIGGAVPEPLEEGPIVFDAEEEEAPLVHASKEPEVVQEDEEEEGHFVSASPEDEEETVEHLAPAVISPFDLEPETPDSPFNTTSAFVPTPAPVHVEEEEERVETPVAFEQSSGAALSAPVAEVAALHLSGEEVVELHQTSETTIQVDPLVEETSALKTAPAAEPVDEEDKNSELAEEESKDESAPGSKASKKALKRASQKAKKAAVTTVEAVTDLKASLNTGALDEVHLE